MHKKILGGLIATFVAISCTYAVEIDCDPYLSNNPNFNQVFDLGLSEEINNSDGNYFELRPKANLLQNDSEQVFHYGNNSRGGRLFWALTGNRQNPEHKLYSMRVGPYGGNTVVRDQGFINYYTVVSGTDKPCIGRQHTIEGFYNNPQFANPDKFGYYDTTYNGFNYCFIYSQQNFSVCFGGENSYFSGSAGITVADLENLNRYYTNSKFGSPNSPVNPENACIKLDNVKSKYGLIPDICYAGYEEQQEGIIMYKAGTGLTLQETYNLYSGGMTITAWYDTYREFYKNGYTDIFSGKDALRGIEFARQTFGKDKNADTIINYCNIELLETTEDSTTCNTTTGAFNMPIKNLVSALDIVAQTVEENVNITKPASGTVFDELGNIEGDYDIRESFKSIYTKLTTIFKFRNGVEGIIPNYITWIILLIVLFKIFRK